MAELSRLKAVLAEEARLLEEMVELEEKTMRILMEGDAGALQSATLHKEALVGKMREMEEQRRTLLPAGLTLREFCRRESHATEDGELEKLRLRILQLHNSLQRILKLNRHLLKHNIQFVELALNMLFPRKDEVLYVSSGKVEERIPFSTGLLDSNA